MRRKYEICWLAWLLVLLTTTALGQAPVATLVGRVSDPSQANVAGASITIRNNATNETRTVKSGVSGQYTISNLAPGTYTVTISMPGFAELREDNLVLTAEQTARLDTALKIGTTSETVNVTADVGLLNTETSSKGDLITPVEIAEIPLNGRDFNDLAFTVAGVQPAEQNAKGAPYVANGSRADSSGVFIDGINDESPRDAGSQISPPLDSLQEFKMETSGYTAQYGRLSGSVVTMVTKSGGNQFHGSLFEFLRNDIFDAAPYNFTNIAVPKTKLRKNQFGGTLGGPIKKDKMFFFVNYEGIWQLLAQTRIATVPNAASRTPSFPRATNPTTYDAIVNTLAIYPMPTFNFRPIPGTSLGTGQATEVASQTAHEHYFLARFDYTVSAKDSFLARYLFDKQHVIDPYTGGNGNAASGFLPFWPER